jgi:hypothetical protein
MPHSTNAGQRDAVFGSANHGPCHTPLNGLKANETRCLDLQDKYVTEWIAEATEERLHWSEVFAEEQAVAEQWAAQQAVQ